MIVGFSGKAGVGKDEAAKILAKIGHSEARFAGALKGVCKRAFGFSHEQMHGDLKREEDPFWGITPAEALQKVGTECFRDVLGKDFWVKALMRRIDDSEARCWVIPDVRFPNEAAAIKERGGLVVRVERPDRPGSGRDDTHPSETALDDYEDFDAVISNDGSLEDYREAVASWVRENLLHAA